MERESRGVQSTADLEQLLARPPRAPSLRLRRHWFVFTDADPFCGIDLDHCRAVKGTIGLEALDMIRRFASYTELSPSGTGAHILIKGKLYGPGNRTRNIEIYDSGRYFTVTGKHLSGTPFAIHNRQEALEALERELFSSEVSFPNEALVNARIMSDEELIERAKSARNGDRFRRLWAGDASDYGDDHSRADLALCRMLAFWCGPDGERVDLPAFRPDANEVGPENRRYRIRNSDCQEGHNPIVKKTGKSSPMMGGFDSGCVESSAAGDGPSTANAIRCSTAGP
jgi:hypothetical protein